MSIVERQCINISQLKPEIIEVTPSLTSEQYKLARFVRNYAIIQSHYDPDVQFGMNREYRVRILRQQRRLACQVGAPKDPVDLNAFVAKSVESLAHKGIPYWRNYGRPLNVNKKKEGL